MNKKSKIMKLSSSRRSFLKSTGIVAAASTVPYFFSTKRTLADEIVSKNDRINIGLIGAGGMGVGNMKAAKDWIDVVAIADVDRSHAENVNKNLSDGKADVYEDYRELLTREDIDALHIATPDHWHTKPLIEAMRAGKDVYCEKPLTLTIDEGKLIRKVQEETGRIIQVGTQQRSTFELFVKAMAIVADGRLGHINRIQICIGGAPASPELPKVDVPASLNWDRWLGQAPYADYRGTMGQSEGKERFLTNGHYEFRWWYEYSGGKLTDWGAHHMDIAAWALELNGQSGGPISVGGEATHPVEFDEYGNPKQGDRYNTATDFALVAKYANGTEVEILSKGRNGVLLEGDKGRLFVNRGSIDGQPVQDLAENPLPEGLMQKVYKGHPMEFDERKAHWANFFHCIKTRSEPISDVHSHMRMLNVCHLAGISARLGRTIQWDDVNEQIIGDEVAASMMSRPCRRGFEIEA